MTRATMGGTGMLPLPCLLRRRRFRPSNRQRHPLHKYVTCGSQSLWLGAAVSKISDYMRVRSMATAEFKQSLRRRQLKSVIGGYALILPALLLVIGIIVFP